MAKESANSTTRDFGVTLTNPAVTQDVNQRLYAILLERSPARAERFKAYRAVFDRAASLDVDLPFPIHLIIETMYACNYQCPMCYLGIPEYKRQFGRQGIMSMEAFRRIVDEAEQYETPSMLLNGVNEPLLDERLVERIRYASDHGFVDIHLHTNGELLTDELSHQLIDSGCTRLMVSLDAFSAETFSQIRVGGNYDKVVANCNRFLEIRRQRGADLPLFRTSFVRQKLNEHEIQAFVDYWAPRADYVHLQTYMELIDVRGYNYYSEADKAVPSAFRCEQPWYAMFIRPKGDAHPCCSFMNYYLPMGNTSTASLYEIWHASPYADLRQLHKRGEYARNDACRKCVKGMYSSR